MNAQEIVDRLQGHKGQHIKVTWQRVAKTLKTSNVLVTKRTSAFVRAGIEYANLASIKNAMESGERSEIQPLAWGEWVERPYIIEHNGLAYVRLYPASFANLTPSVEWSLNGIPATFETVSPYLLASEKRHEDNAPACFTVKAESIIAIG